MWGQAPLLCPAHTLATQGTHAGPGWLPLARWNVCTGISSAFVDKVRRRLGGPSGPQGVLFAEGKVQGSPTPGAGWLGACRVGPLELWNVCSKQKKISETLEEGRNLQRPQYLLFIVNFSFFFIFFFLKRLILLIMYST